MIKCVICNGYFNEPSYNHKPYWDQKLKGRKYICKSCMLLKFFKYEAWEPYKKTMIDAAKIPFEMFKRKESEE